MTQNEREQLEVLLGKQLREQPETARDSQECPDPGWISAYLEGELSQALKTTLESHVCECRRCQEELAFLLKTFPAEPVKEAQKAQTAGNKLRDLFGLGRIEPVFLKPVFAILIVALVSGVVGYKIIYEQKAPEEKATQIADSMARRAEPSVLSPETTNDQETGTAMNSRPASKSTQPQGNAPTIAEKPRSNQSPRATNEDRRYSPPHELQSSLSKDDSKSGSFEIARKGASQSGEKEINRKDLNEQPAASPQVAAAPLGSTGASVQTPARAGVAEGDSRLREKDSVQDKKAAPKLLAEAESTNQLTATSPIAKRATIAKKKAATTDEAAYAAKTEESKGAVGPVDAVENSSVQPRRIQLAGKNFELRDNVWVDLSISQDEDYLPVVIRKGSQDYIKLEKELAAYQDLLSRPEDCLIKLKDRVYRIQKK